MLVSDGQLENFLDTLWGYYRKSGRHDLAWRQPDPFGRFDPYKILVSELMLQQTQVSRVIPKYASFLVQFPNVASLASASLADVLCAWQGLGYNRRAKFLWQSAQSIEATDAFPVTMEGLVALPGVGQNTAGAILAYAYNQPAIFIETNIRTVLIHHFFEDGQRVSDAAIREILANILDAEHPRDFYWALMDYGAWLKSKVHNVAQSKHYVRQSRFEGSRRQIRGQVIRELTGGSMGSTELANRISDDRLTSVLEDLVSEKLVFYDGSVYSLGVSRSEY